MQMNLFENIKIFIEIVDAGSFAQAAENLQIHRPAVTKALQQLEQETKEQAARLRECQEQLVVSSSQKEQLGKAEALCKRYKERLDAMKERCADMEVIECAVPNRRVW